MIYLVSYDIADDMRRLAVATLLSGYGARVQLSMFECDLADADGFRDLRDRVETMIEPAEDQVRFYPLPSNVLRDRVILGNRTLEERQDYWIV